MNLIRSIVVTLGIFISISASANYSKKYYGFHLCDRPDFRCEKVLRGHTWESLYPNESTRTMIKKLNRTNIPLRHRSYHVIPESNFVDYMSLSPMPASVSGHNEKVVIVDLSQQAFAAYDAAGNKLRWGPISGGRGYCPDVGRSCRTVTGSFRVYRKGGPGCVSRKYDNAPMPYCMFFYKGFAMHGAALPGYHASHGCVRMFRDDAHWLNKQFADIGTKVIVTKGFK